VPLSVNWRGLGATPPIRKCKGTFYNKQNQRVGRFGWFLIGTIDTPKVFVT